MKAWLSSLRIYREKRLVAILLMGFSSGLPLPLTFATLSFWLAEAGVSRSSIGLFVLVGFSYNYKFLWSPILDRLAIPWATRRLGRRRSWALLIQALLVVTIVLLGRTDPHDDLATTAVLAALVAFLSASQDIVIDAFRIELLNPEEQGAGAAATQWGYRFGLLAAGAGALYAAEFGGWQFAYGVMGALMGVGIVTVLLTREPASPAATRLVSGQTSGVIAWLREAVLLPFADLVRRQGWLAVLIFIVLYKLGEAMAGSMANPLYQELGFSKVEVANIAKLAGFVATLGGVAFGGLLVARRGILQALLLGGVLQMLSNLMYVAQVLAGHSNTMLALSIFTENFTNGMGSAAFVAYLSSLCSVAFTATQYALFSSLAALPTRLLSAPSGWLVDQLGWIPFFLLTTAAAVPGILVLFWLMKRERLMPSALGATAQP
jgi:PAT family beta-lactamase induction signal transducer AmpG